jgi:uncharacterized protein
MRAAGLAAVIAVYSAACGRIEEPPPSRPVQTATSPATPARSTTEVSHSTPARSPSARLPAPNSNRCVVPTPEKPPPRALPAARCPPDPQGAPELPKASLVFVDAPGAPRISLERALTDEHRARGLMYRTRMPENHGMLFSWETEQVQSFWMRNTCIPLDMLFVSEDNTIAGILEQVPTLNEASRTIPCPVAHVLEVNAGYCRKHGIVAGQRISLE